MVKPSKLYLALLANTGREIAFRDFERLLEAFGFTMDRIVGSHRQYVHPKVPRTFPVQPSGKDAKRYQVREFLALVEQFDLEMAP